MRDFKDLLKIVLKKFEPETVEIDPEIGEMRVKRFKTRYDLDQDITNLARIYSSEIDLVYFIKGADMQDITKALMAGYCGIAREDLDEFRIKDENLKTLAMGIRELANLNIRMDNYNKDDETQFQFRYAHSEICMVVFINVSAEKFTKDELEKFRTSFKRCEVLELD